MIREYYVDMLAIRVLTSFTNTHSVLTWTPSRTQEGRGLFISFTTHQQ